MSCLHWYYTRGIRDAFTLASRFLFFFWRFFNIIYLAQTLLSPWKRDVALKTWRGFSFSQFFTRFVGNAMSRFIGAIVRILTIFLGLICIATYISTLVVIALIWIFFPLLLTLIPFTALLSWPITTVIVLLSILLIFLVSIAYAYFINTKPDYSQMDLEQLQTLPWFSRIYDRLEIPKEQRLRPLFDDMDNFKKILAQKKLGSDDFSQLLSWEVARQIKIQKNTFGPKMLWITSHLSVNSGISPTHLIWTHTV